MAVFGGGEIHADPKTASQLRAALAAGKLKTDDLSAAIEAVSGDITIIDGQVGPVDAEFDSLAVIGQAVYVPSSGHVDLADASDPLKSGVVGIVSAGAAAGVVGSYITAGRITAANWTGATGSALLTAGVVYYSSPTTPGRITATAPTTTGQTVVIVGRALTTTTLEVTIEPGILL